MVSPIEKQQQQKHVFYFIFRSAEGREETETPPFRPNSSTGVHGWERREYPKKTSNGWEREGPGFQKQPNIFATVPPVCGVSWGYTVEGREYPPSP